MDFLYDPNSGTPAMGGLDPELLKQVIGMGQNDPNAPKVAQQQKMIDLLRRNSSQPVQNNQMAGKIVLPNFGQVGSNMLGNFQADQMQGQVDQQTQQMGQRDNAARGGYLDALVKAMRRPTPPQPPGTGSISESQYYTNDGAY